MTIKGREGRLAATKLNLEMQLIQFIQSEKGILFPHNKQLRAYGSEIYIRHWITPITGETLDIATISIRRENQRQGIFTYLLGIAERECFAQKYDHIKIENVLHPGLDRFLRKRGYRAVPGMTGTNSFYWACNAPPTI